jgi:hypothetical protein
VRVASCRRPPTFSFLLLLQAWRRESIGTETRNYKLVCCECFALYTDFTALFPYYRLGGFWLPWWFVFASLRLSSFVVHPLAVGHSLFRPSSFCFASLSSTSKKWPVLLASSAFGSAAFGEVIELVSACLLDVSCWASGSAHPLVGLQNHETILESTFT